MNAVNNKKISNQISNLMNLTKYKETFALD